MVNNLKSHIEYLVRHNYFLNRKIKKIDEAINNPNFEAIKNEHLVQLIQNCFKNNHFYSKLYKEYGVNINSIKGHEDLNKLPKIDKEIVRKNSNKIKMGSRLLLKKGYTSGTTGSPLIVYRDYDSILTENAYVWWYRIKSGLMPKDKKVVVRGDLNRDTLFYLDRAFNTLYVSSYGLNDVNLNKIYTKIQLFNPKAILAYPSSIYLIAKWLEKNNKNLFIEKAFTSSETLLSFQEDFIKRRFGSTIYDWYGNAERTIALYRDKSKYYEPPLYSVNEYGKENIITTTLINNYFPLIRYEVNDIVNTNNVYSDIKKSITINSINGRKEDFIILSDGSVIGRLDVVFKGIKNIEMSQIIQNEIHSINVNIVTIQGFNNEDEEELMKNLISKLGNDISIKINKVKRGDLEYNNGKKFKFVISKIDKAW